MAFATYHQSAIVQSHHDESTHLFLGFRGETELCGDGKLIGRRLLEQHVGYFPEIFPTLRQLIGVEAEGAEGGRHTELLIIIAVPLPLQSNGRCIKVIALHRVDDNATR